MSALEQDPATDDRTTAAPNHTNDSHDEQFPKEQQEVGHFIQNGHPAGNVFHPRNLTITDQPENSNVYLTERNDT